MILGQCDNPELLAARPAAVPWQAEPLRDAVS